jgi:hypothetical protein
MINKEDGHFIALFTLGLLTFLTTLWYNIPNTEFACPNQNRKLLATIVEENKLICIYDKTYTKLQRKERLELFRKGQL